MSNPEQPQTLKRLQETIWEHLQEQKPEPVRSRLLLAQAANRIEDLEVQLKRARQNDGD